MSSSLKNVKEMEKMGTLSPNTVALAQASAQYIEKEEKSMKGSLRIRSKCAKNKYINVICGGF